jgi:hypothetical protein
MVPANWFGKNGIEMHHPEAESMSHLRARGHKLEAGNSKISHGKP